MRRIALLLSLAVVVSLLAGCGQSPYSAGVAMAKEHCAFGMNPPPEKVSQMQAEVVQKTASYSMAQKQDFMKGYLEGVMEEMGGELMNQAMQQASRSVPPPRY
jgi:hypothetical protein